MNILMKKSHCFSIAVFCGATCGLALMLLVRAAVGAAAWDDIPSILVLSALVSGLLAIGFNLAWLQMREKLSHESREEPHDYAPTQHALSVTAMAVVVAISLLGAAFGTAGWVTATEVPLLRSANK